MPMTMDKLVELHRKMCKAVQDLDDFHQKCALHNDELHELTELENIQEDIDGLIIHKAAEAAEKKYELAIAEMVDLQ